MVSMRRTVAFALALTAAAVLALSARAGSATTLRFTVLFQPGGRVVAHPPAGEPGNETYVNLKLTGMPGTGTVYTVAAKDGRSTRYRFRFVFRTGTLGLTGTISATASGGTSQRFTVSSGTGAYKG